MNILVVDDDLLLQQTIELCLADRFSVVSASNFDQALALLEKTELDGALVDIHLGASSRTGLEFLSIAKDKFPDIPIVMMSGENSASVVVQCIQMGADDFIEKPFKSEGLSLRLNKAFFDKRRNRVFRRAFDLTKSRNQIIGSSPDIEKGRKLIERAGRMRILFQGETGVGKTPFAWYSNQFLSREESEPRPFEQVNCAGLTKEHFQDLLFGHKKGAYTGAASDKRGLVELAKGGDLFLDELGEMPLDTQALFLTFIDTQDYYRLGDDQKRKADVRILCATNRNLKTMITEGSFRKDLYSRVAQVVVDIPPLRNRRTDIPALFEHFIDVFSGYPKAYQPELLERIVQHSWEEGNVRELRDTVEYLCTTGRESENLMIEHLPDRLQSLSHGFIAETMDLTTGDWVDVAERHGLESCLGSIEKQLLEHFLRKCGGVTDIMAVKLHASRPTLYRRLKRYGIALENDSSAELRGPSVSEVTESHP